MANFGGPGPIADRTFENGFRLAVAGGLAGIVLLYWFGGLSVLSGLHVTLTLALFPVYLLFVSIVLGVWLGYGTDEADLERVTVTDSEEERDRRLT